MSPTEGGGKMQSIIEELYYGNVLPFERRAPRGGEYARIIKYMRIEKAHVEFEKLINKYSFTIVAHTIDSGIPAYHRV